MDARHGNLKICPICDRSFSNGKALGGHMKSHSRDLEEIADETDVGESSNGGHKRWGLVMEPPEEGCAVTGKRGRPEVSPVMPMDVMEAAKILLEIGGNRGLLARDSGEDSELNNVIVQGLRSDRKKAKMEDPDWDPRLDFGLGCFKCPRCTKAFVSRRALAGHRLKHNREGSGPSQVGDPGPVSGNRSTREVGQMEQIREEGSSVEPVRLNQQPWVGHTLSPDAQIPEMKLVIDLNFPPEPKDD